MTHFERSNRRSEIIRRIQEGEDRNDLATEYGLSLATIKGMITKKVGLHPSTYQIIADLINTNESISDLAIKRGCSRQWIYTVIDRLKAVGINIKSR
jgi:Mor family transcriptional regulator